MEHLQNLHTHTVYCDGKNTPEEMILAAMAKGFEAIGFSGHAHMFYANNYHMSPKGTVEYRREIYALKEKYAGKIRVYCGLEYDLYCNEDVSEYEYLIGSVHYLNLEGRYVAFDRPADVVRKVIDEEFGGDGLKYTQAYYRALATLPEYGKFDIIGHFDLVTKHAEKVRFFDETASAYRNAAIEAAEALAGKIPFFEVNTGAIARGNRTTPYPAVFIMKELKRLGFGAVITSDCHDAEKLDCGFELAAELLKSCGFRERYILTDEGFLPAGL